MPDYIDKLVNHLKENKDVYGYAEIAILISEDGTGFYVMIHPLENNDYIPNGHSYGDLDGAIHLALERSEESISDFWLT